MATACQDHPQAPVANIPVSPAPAFKIQTLSGQMLSSKDLTGKIVILNCWAIWSPDSAREIPELIQIRNSLDRKNIAIVDICLQSHNVQQIRAFVRQMKMDYPVSLQNNAFVDSFGGIDSIPSTFVIDPDWNLVNRYTGKIQANEFRQQLTYLLHEFKIQKESNSSANAAADSR